MGKLCNKHQRVEENIPYGLVEGKIIRHFICPECHPDIYKTKTQWYAEYVEKKSPQAKINQLLKNAMMAPRFREKSFETYLINSEINRIYQKEALRVSKTFAENLRGMGLLFLGESGNGKNHLAAAIINQIIQDGKTALMLKAIKLFRAVKESWDKKSSTKESQIIDSCVTPDLLVIDEIGVQVGSDTEMRIISEIIDDRYENYKPSILIGNVTVDELNDLIGTRAVDRFKEGGRVVVFNWESYRGTINKPVEAINENTNKS